MARYRLLIGQHIEPVKGREEGRKILQGEVFESDNDWYAKEWPEKFERVDGAVPGGFVFDPARETLEQFSERVKQAQTTRATSPVAEAAQQGFNTLYTDSDQEPPLETMSVKQLTRLAQEAGIDLQGSTRKEDIIRLIRSALSATTTVDE